MHKPTSRRNYECTSLPGVLQAACQCLLLQDIACSVKGRIRLHQKYVKVLFSLVNKVKRKQTPLYWSQPKGGKSYLSNLIPFYDKVTYPVDKEKPVEVIFLYFIRNSKYCLSWSILLDKISSVPAG